MRRDRTLPQINLVRLDARIADEYEDLAWARPHVEEALAALARGDPKA